VAKYSYPCPHCTNTLRHKGLYYFADSRPYVNYYCPSCRADLFLEIKVAEALFREVEVEPLIRAPLVAVVIEDRDYAKLCAAWLIEGDPRFDVLTNTFTFHEPTEKDLAAATVLSMHNIFRACAVYLDAQIADALVLEAFANSLGKPVYRWPDITVPELRAAVLTDQSKRANLWYEVQLLDMVGIPPI